MAYKEDPGGQFESDVHRRVLAVLPQPGESAEDTATVVERFRADVDSPDLDADEVESVISDLEAEGYAGGKGDSHVMLKAGFSKLTGPIANEPPPLEGDALARAQAENDQWKAKNDEQHEANRKAIAEALRAALKEVEK